MIVPNELMQYMNGDRRPASKADRDKARKAEQIRTEVQLAGLMADGAMQFAAHVMDGFDDLDEHRKSLAGGDPLKNMALGEFEAQALRQIKGIQRSLFNNWGL